jgi:hypothetical protein
MSFTIAIDGKTVDLFHLTPLQNADGVKVVKHFNIVPAIHANAALARSGQAQGHVGGEDDRGHAAVAHAHK